MSQVSDAYDRLIQCFIDWAETVPDIRSAVILGSRARTNRPADDWSDLDLIFFTTTPQTYLTTTDWISRMGPYWLMFIEKTADGRGRERRVLFENALDVDFVPIPAEALSTNAPPDAFMVSIFHRGYRVILDKDNVLEAVARAILTVPEPLPQMPTEGEFLNVVNDFWYHIVWSAKKMRRGELWMALSCLNNYLKGACIQPMITWHARALHGPDYDTWMNGRFLDQWADPRVVEGLRATYARYDADDFWRALFGSMELFRWLAPETAEKLGYPYPAESEQRVTEWVKTCFAESLVC